MALEMKTHKDIAAFEAKPMFGVTWRGLAAIAIMLLGGGALFFGVASVVLTTSGTSWGAAVSAAMEGTDDPAVQALTRATSTGMYVMFPVLVPVAFWAWWRPMGLKPEIYAQYLFRHQLTSKVTHYEDTYSHTSVPSRSSRVDESVSSSGAGGFAQRTGAFFRRFRSRDARANRELSEHAQGPSRHSRGGR